MRVAKRPGASSTTGRNTHSNPVDGGTGAMARVRDIQTLQTCTSVQASIHTHVNHPRPLNRRDIVHTRPSRRPGRVASTGSLRVLDCRVLWVQPN